MAASVATARLALPPGRTPEVRPSGPPGPLVFVVERDDAVRDAVAVSLEDAGYRVAGFATARDFLAACRSSEPGCVVLDLDLPEADGPVLLEALRAHQVTPPMVVTTPALRRHRRRVREFPRVVALLEKPFGNPELLAPVEHALRQAA